MRKMTWILGAMLALVMTVGVVQAQEQEAHTLDNAVLVVKVDNLQGLLEGLGPVVSAVMPGMDANGLKNMLGMQLGDPTLQGMPTGAGAALVMWPDSRTASFLEVTRAQQDAYAMALQQRGMASVKAGNMLVLPPPMMPDTTEYTALASSVGQTILGGPGDSRLAIEIRSDNAATMVQPQIEGMLQMMMASQAQGAGQSPEDMQAAMRILEAEVKGFMDLLGQTDLVSISLGGAGQALELAMLAEPKAGSDLAAFAQAQTGSADEVAAMLPPVGAVRYASVYDTDALMQLVDGVAQRVGGAMSLTPEEQTTIDKMIGMMRNTYGTGMGGAMMVPGSGLLSGAQFYRVGDTEKAINTLAESPEQMAGYLDMYKSMGMDMSVDFARNTAEHGGIPVHQFKTTMDMTEDSQAAVGQRQMLQQMLGGDGTMQIDVAGAGDYMIYAMGDTSVGEMIDAAKAGRHAASMPMQAQQVFSGAQMIADLNIGDMIQVMFPMMQSAMNATGGSNPQMDQMMQSIQMSFQGAEPVTMGAFYGNGRAPEGRVHIPAALIGKLQQVMMMVQMQMMQQAQGGMQQGAMAPQPAGTAESVHTSE